MFRRFRLLGRFRRLYLLIACSRAVGRPEYSLLDVLVWGSGRTASGVTACQRENHTDVRAATAESLSYPRSDPCRLPTGPK